MRLVVLGWLSVAALAGCAGESRHHVDGSGAAAALAGTAGAPAAAGGTTSTGGDGATGGAPTIAISAAGAGGTSGSGGADCGSSTPSCCDRNAGVFVASACDAATGEQQCSHGAVEVQSVVCAPTGYDVDRCSELEYTPCTSVGLECHENIRCGTFGECELDSPSDLPVWICNGRVC